MHSFFLSVGVFCGVFLLSRCRVVSCDGLAATVRAGGESDDEIGSPILRSPSPIPSPDSAPIEDERKVWIRPLSLSPLLFTLFLSFFLCLLLMDLSFFVAFFVALFFALFLACLLACTCSHLT